ncbi:hypothetical protein, partial [Succinimonas sp.]|uniref:hypothetical protein n=1 Tax=Succinimonas sp. TaxID=1936151 RepID=UPI00386C4C9C
IIANSLKNHVFTYSVVFNYFLPIMVVITQLFLGTSLLFLPALTVRDGYIRCLLQSAWGGADISSAPVQGIHRKRQSGNPGNIRQGRA